MKDEIVGGVDIIWQKCIDRKENESALENTNQIGATEEEEPPKNLRKKERHEKNQRKELSWKPRKERNSGREFNNAKHQNENKYDWESKAMDFFLSTVSVV